MCPYNDTHNTFYIVPSDAPGDLRITHTCPRSANISWSPIPVEQHNGFITGYTVTVQVKGANATIIKEIPIDKDATSFEVTNLTPFTLYHFGVCAKTEEGSGPTANASSKTPEAGEFSLL